MIIYNNILFVMYRIGVYKIIKWKLFCIFVIIFVLLFFNIFIVVGFLCIYIVVIVIIWG